MYQNLVMKSLFRAFTTMKYHVNMLFIIEPFNMTQHCTIYITMDSDAGVVGDSLIYMVQYHL